MKSILFAKRVFLIAGIYGLLVLVPQLFLENRINANFPPPMTHPEQFYGFTGIAIAWQVMFLIIGRDPVRYRPAMIPSILEKIAFGGGSLVLFLQDRLALQIFAVAMVDLLWMVLFFVAWLRTPKVVWS
jgi:hypothetical protein